MRREADQQVRPPGAGAHTLRVGEREIILSQVHDVGADRSATSRRSFTQNGTPAARQSGSKRRPAASIARAVAAFARSCRQHGAAPSNVFARASSAPSSANRSGAASSIA